MAEVLTQAEIDSLLYEFAHPTNEEAPRSNQPTILVICKHCGHMVRSENLDTTIIFTNRRCQNCKLGHSYVSKNWLLSHKTT